MKKYLIVLAALALTLVGCKNEPKVIELTGISFKDTAITVFEGDEVLVKLLAAPEGAVIPDDIEITSSDTDVVVIIDKKVTFEAVGTGEANIIAKCGDLKAVCRVTVTTIIDAWTPDWLYYFPSSVEPISDDTIEYQGYKCVLNKVRFFVPNPLQFSTDDGSGEGYAIWFWATIPYVAEGENAGQMFGRAAIFTDDTTKLATEPWAALAGSIDASLVGPACQNYLESYAAGSATLSDADKAALEAGNQGAGIYYTWSDEDGVGPSYFCSGIINSGWMQLTGSGDARYVNYDFVAQWDYWDFLNCLNIDPEATSIAAALINPYELALTPKIHYAFGQPAELAEDIAPRKAPAAFKATMARKLEKPVRAKFVVAK